MVVDLVKVFLILFVVVPIIRNSRDAAWKNRFIGMTIGY